MTRPARALSPSHALAGLMLGAGLLLQSGVMLSAGSGRQNIGGSIATASGLIFIGATDDAHLRAFDAQTGAELWAFNLEASAHATPITYLGSDGRHYVAVVATGGSFLDSPIASDALSVFALP